MAKLDFGFLFRIFRSSNNLLIVALAGFLLYLEIPKEQIAISITAVTGVSIGGARLEDSAKKIGGGIAEALKAWKENK